MKNETREHTQTHRVILSPLYHYHSRISSDLFNISFSLILSPINVCTATERCSSSLCETKSASDESKLNRPFLSSVYIKTLIDVVRFAVSIGLL